MRKKIIIAVGAILLLILFLFALKLENKTIYDDPEYMSDAALQCIFGWKDTSMFMPLTPFQDGTAIYKRVLSEVSDIMAEIGWNSTFTNNGSIDLKKANRSLYDTLTDTLSQNNITGVKSIKGYTYGFQDGDEITVYVAKIKGKWYTVSIEITDQLVEAHSFLK